MNGYETLDSINEVSARELKIPANTDTDRGVDKSIFYGSHRVSDLNQEVQRYQNDMISGAEYTKDFSKT